MTFKEVASAQVGVLIPPAKLPEGFHPSIGLPEQLIGYSPCPLFRTGTGNLHSRELATTSSHPILTTKIPPAVIPLIFAHRQWRAGLVLADLIAYHSQRRTPRSSSFNVRGTAVLELGCGTAIPGMVAAKLCGASTTLVTDYDSPSLISTLASNLRANFDAQEVKSNIRAVGFTWGSSTEDLKDVVDAMLREQRKTGRVPQLGQVNSAADFDRILLADCLWDPLSHADLMKSLTRLLARDCDSNRHRPWILIVSGLHTGRDKLTSFIHRAARDNLVLLDVGASTDGDNEPIFPDLDEAEEQVAQIQQAQTSSDDPLYNAPRFVYELELAEDEDKNADMRAPLVVGVGQSPGSSPVIDTSRSARLTGKRRTFVLQEREEERKEAGGVHRRNRWITVWALGWKR